MTCIVAVAKAGVVHMGADSAGVGGYSMRVRTDPKIYRNGKFLFGFTTSFRMGQLLGYAFEPPTHYAHEGTVEKFMATKFVDAVRKCLKDGGFARKESEEERGGVFLVGYEGRIFRIDCDYQVGESAYGFDAVGCGDDIAMGAMWALSGKFDVSPDTQLRTALNAAEQFSAGVRGPFLIVSSEAAIPKVEAAHD